MADDATPTTPLLRDTVAGLGFDPAAWDGGAVTRALAALEALEPGCTGRMTDALATLGLRHANAIRDQGGMN